MKHLLSAFIHILGTKSNMKRSFPTFLVKRTYGHVMPHKSDSRRFMLHFAARLLVVNPLLALASGHDICFANAATNSRKSQVKMPLYEGRDDHHEHSSTETSAGLESGTSWAIQCQRSSTSNLKLSTQHIRRRLASYEKELWPHKRSMHLYYVFSIQIFRCIL